MKNNRKLSYERIRKNTTIKINRCPTCGSRNIARRNEILLGGRTISVCKNCQIGFSNEIVPQVALESI